MQPGKQEESLFEDAFSVSLPNVEKWCFLPGFAWERKSEDGEEKEKKVEGGAKKKRKW